MARTEDLAKGVSKFIRDVRIKALGDDVREELSRAYAEDAAQAIKRHARQGYGLRQDGDTLSRLKRLSPAYIERRAQMRLHPETSAGKSNLTLRGDLLDSITARATTRPKWGVVMPGDHYSGVSNAKLAGYLSRERPFLFLARSEMEALGRNHLDRFNALVNRAFG